MQIEIYNTEALDTAGASEGNPRSTALLARPLPDRKSFWLCGGREGRGRRDGRRPFTRQVFLLESSRVLTEAVVFFNEVLADHAREQSLSRGTSSQKTLTRDTLAALEDTTEEAEDQVLPHTEEGQPLYLRVEQEEGFLSL